MLPIELKYTEEHEWISIENNIATIGITSYASDELGEIVFVELPEIGKEIPQMEECGAIESIKTLANVFSPITGEITETNEILVNNPNTINESPYEDGWLFKMKIFDTNELDDLMSYKEYKTYLETL
jgi:glycine cleavage system H protein